MSRHQKKPSGDKSVEGKSPRPDKEKTSHSGPQLLRKPLSATNGLPTILLTSGPNINEIKSQIIIFCQQRGIGKIAKCLDSGLFETKEILEIDNALLGDQADPHNFQRDAYMEDRKAINEDFRLYLKSKEQLVGIIKSMTDKLLDDKLTTTFQQQQVEVDKTIAEMQARPVTAANTAEINAAEVNVFISTNRIDTLCPLQIWTNIVFITTTKASGNKRIDQDTAVRQLSNMRQRQSENLGEYLQRFNNAKDTYTLLGLTLPREESLAITYIQGLDPSKYSDLLTYLHNELSNGRDIFPTDLAGAVSKASKWLVSSPKGPREAAQHSVYGAFIKTEKKKDKEKGKTKDREKDGRPTEIKPNDIVKTCAYCNKVGHNILKCFKLIKDQAASKSDGNLDNKKGVAVPTITRQDELVEESTGFSSFPTIGRNSGSYTAFPVFKNITDSTKAALAFGGADSIDKNSILVDTGANFSIVKDIDLVTDVKPCAPVIFDGLKGTLTVNQCGSLLGICPAYYHPDAVANIISFSQVKDLGLNIIYNGANDEFVLTFGMGTCSFTRRGNGLYICDIQSTALALVTTVSENEAHFTSREVREAREARDLQRRLGNPTDSSLCKVLSQGFITNKHVLPTHVVRATEIYGPNIEGLKGRTTRKKGIPLPLTHSRRVTEEQTMYVDIFFACGLIFLITLVNPLGHTITTNILKTDIKTLRTTIRQHLGRYGQKNIHITQLHSDNEKGITAMALDFSGSGIALLQVGPGMHIPQIERKIRYIKELARSVRSGLPYLCSSKMFVHLITFVTTRANMFPSTTTPHGDSPFRLLEGRTPSDIDTHLEFGAYYHVSARVMDNSMESRTTSAIGIAQIPNGTGSCKFMVLKPPYSIITANHFIHVPINQDVINALNELASLDSRPIPLDPVFRYHGADLTDKTPDLEPLVESTDPPVTKSYAPIQRLEDILDTEEESALFNDSRQKEKPPIAESRGGNEADDLIPEQKYDSDSDDDDDNDDTADDENENVNDVEKENDKENTLTLPIPPSPHLSTTLPSDTPSDTDQIATTPYSRPIRIRRAPDKLNLVAAVRYSIFHITAKRAMREMRETAEPAIMLELTNITKKGVLMGRHVRDLTPKQISGIIPSHMNITPKYSPTSDGSGRTILSKAKARLVAGGDHQDRNMYSRTDITSPTCSITGLFTHAALACMEEEEVVVTDVTCAYLNARMPKDNPEKLVFLRIDPFITPLLLKVNPSLQPYVTPGGTIIVELNRALYGCIESAKLWFEELTNTLKNMGFSPNDCDPCLLTRYQNGVRTTVIIYVDDLMITSKKFRYIQEVITSLEKKYDKLKISTGKIHSYIGMVFNFTTNVLIIDQIGMIEDILISTRIAIDEYITTSLSPVQRTSADKLRISCGSASAKTPAATYLLNVSPTSPPLNENLKCIFHSTVAKLMFISNRSRQDLLLAISFLAGRVLFPTEEDWGKLMRILRYLESTKMMRLQLGCTTPIQVHTSIDSSFNPISSGKSRSGVSISLGRGVIYSKSTVQKINTTSSCQAELVALAKGLQQSLFLYYFLKSHGYPPLPVIVSQDNQSTIKLIENGRPTSELSRHIEIGYFWAKDLVERKLIEVNYCPTEEMIADFFTKPLQSQPFNFLRGKIMGTSPLDPTYKNNEK